MAIPKSTGLTHHVDLKIVSHKRRKTRKKEKEARQSSHSPFHDAARNEGYRADYDFWAEQNAWLTTVHIRMVPTLEEITAMELTLGGIARSFGGEPDGWGCMEVDGTPAR